MISVRDVRKVYDYGLVKALNGVSFEIEEGEAVSIMGPSGCGKSTLLNLIGTLDMPTEGEIWFDGKNLIDYRPMNAFRAKKHRVYFSISPSDSEFEFIRKRGVTYVFPSNPQ